MATTSIWRIKGWLGSVVIYIENPEKTDSPILYEKQGMAGEQVQSLLDVIEYAMDEDKTEITGKESDIIVRRFVSGVNCYPGTAREEMLAVKRRFGKEDGTVAYHGYQSFAPGEATPEIAHEIGVKLAERLWGDHYQVLVATHLDHENHLHNHFVVNTVSFIDGLKYHRTGKDYRDMREASDALCREYGLSVIENPQPGKAKHYGEWRAEQENRHTWRGLIKTDVDEAINTSMTERQFWDALKKKGYEVKIGKDISIRPPGKERFVRLMRNFGEEYDLSRIRDRIMDHGQVRPLPESEQKKFREEYHRSLADTKKATGFLALYYHYCYLLGYFPKKKPNHQKRLHFLLREDLLKMEAISEEAKLLDRCQIDTAEQLSSYKAELEQRVETATARRRELYKKQRSTVVRTDEEKLSAVKVEISMLTAELKNLRKEVKLCEGIALRSCAIEEKIEAIKKDEQTREEETKNEPLRRRSRTGR